MTAAARLRKEEFHAKLRLPSNQGAVVSMKLEGDPGPLEHLLLVQNRECIQRETGLTVEDVIIAAPRSGVAEIVCC